MPLLPQQSARIRLAVRLFLTSLFLAIVAVPPSNASPQSAGNSATDIPILISDFELFAVPPSPNSPGTGAPNRQSANPAPAPEEASVPSIQARRLMDFFAATLVETFSKGGYTVRHTGARQLSKGALLRGVFAEPDEKNRIRRTLLGGTSVNPKFFLYVGIFNLARPDQPLYQLAQEQPGGNQFGPVITLNNYIPLAKYELDKNPSDEDVRKICTQIAASLEALLAANPSAFAQ
jgi:hypothetical protein